MAEDSTKCNTQDNEMPTPKIRHDWYQTEAYVIITILAKNADNANIIYDELTLSVTAKLPNGNDYSLELDLAHPVVPDQCIHKITSSKIEIKLKKRDGCRWTVLEGNPVKQEVEKISDEILRAGSVPPIYPSSCKISKDWDKVAKDIEKQDTEENLQGDGALNYLFQQIYGNGSDEVRRAMNKSFQESSGTVLSTNWSEVGQKTVERKPPAGVEWKSWDS